MVGGAVAGMADADRARPALASASTARMSVKRPSGRATITIGTVVSTLSGITVASIDGLPAISGAMNSTVKLAITTV